MVHEVTKSQTKLQRLSTHIHVGRQRITEAVGPKSGHQPSSAQNSSEALASLPPTAHKASSHASDSPPHCLALCTPCQPHRLPGAPGTQPAHVDHRPLHWLLPLPQMLSADSHGRSLHRLGVFPRRPSALEGRSDLRIVAAALTPAPPDTPWAPHAALVFISLRPPLSCSGASLTCPVRLLSVSPLRAVAAGGSLHLEVVWRIQSVLNAWLMSERTNRRQSGVAFRVIQRACLTPVHEDSGSHCGFLQSGESGSQVAWGPRSGRPKGSCPGQNEQRGPVGSPVLAFLPH